MDKDNPNVQPCCKEDTNLVIKEQTEDKVIKVCKVCNRRHFEFSVDIAKIGLVFTN